MSDYYNISEYIRSGNSDINPDLRAGVVPDECEDIDEELDGIETVEATVYRVEGYATVEDATERVRAIIAADGYADQAYVSTTAQQNNLETLAAVLCADWDRPVTIELVIESRTGRWIGDAVRDIQDEVLFRRGTAFDLISVEDLRADYAQAVQLSEDYDDQDIRYCPTWRVHLREAD
jgi:nitrogen regulatory protein PII